MFTQSVFKNSHQPILLTGETDHTYDKALSLLREWSNTLGEVQLCACDKDIFNEGVVGESSPRLADIHELLRKVRMHSSERSRRCVFIPSAQRLSNLCSNALLKTLEELPSNTLWLMTAPSPRSIISTLRSRLAIIRVPSPQGHPHGPHASLSDAGGLNDACDNTKTSREMSERKRSGHDALEMLIQSGRDENLSNLEFQQNLLRYRRLFQTIPHYIGAKAFQDLINED